MRLEWEMETGEMRIKKDMVIIDPRERERAIEGKKKAEERGNVAE